MNTTAVNAYDIVSYPGSSFSQTHPDRLATLATLFGMKPKPVECSRVLELGCGDGGNLIPMSFELPESEFVGIDLAARPIAKGQAMVEVVGLKNITLRQFDIMDVSRDFGQFDYIIAHGIYSWVPPIVRDKILAVVSENLAPAGVAYVSYNAYPGWHMGNMIRDMMLFHVRQIEEPQQKINQARALIRFLTESQYQETSHNHPGNDVYRIFLEKELDRLMRKPDGTIYHDELEGINSPVYFYQFIEHAAQHGLKYLGEADFFEMHSNIFPPHVSGMLRQLANDSIIFREQYLDFLKCRKFRQTLLCHQDVSLDRRLRPEKMSAFYAASPIHPVSQNPDINSESVEEFRSVNGATMSTGHPLAKAAMLHLSETWPQSTHFNELLTKARSHTERDSGDDEAGLAQDALVLGEILLAAYAANLLELRLHVPHFMLEVSEYPVASPIARLQIQHGNIVTTLRHSRVHMEDILGKHLLPLLDGTRNKAALINDLTALIESGDVIVELDEEQTSDTSTAVRYVTDVLEQKLAIIARLALLVA